MNKLHKLSTADSKGLGSVLDPYRVTIIWSFAVSQRNFGRLGWDVRELRGLGSRRNLPHHDWDLEVITSCGCLANNLQYNTALRQRQLVSVSISLSLKFTLKGCQVGEVGQAVGMHGPNQLTQGGDALVTRG